MNDLWQKTLVHLSEGNFTSLENDLGGRDSFRLQILEWSSEGKFDSEPEALAECFAASCWLGQVEIAEYLLDKGIDPYAGMKTGLSGFHWAASSGQLDVIKLLIERKIPAEIKGMYDNTVLGQALWSAVNEHTDRHAKIIELLIEAGAHVWPNTLEWWNEQPVPSAETKIQVAEALELRGRFDRRHAAASEAVEKARTADSKDELADALRDLGNIERRPPFTREAANKTYVEAAELYREIGRPLDAAWVIRHVGINHEYAGRLTNAESAYDETLALYREHSIYDDLDYANAVRYVAVIKNRLGKRDESEKLWREAVDRYEKVGIADGIVEGRLHLANFAIDRGDLKEARKWLEDAVEAARKSDDPGTHKFIAEVTRRIGDKDE